MKNKKTTAEAVAVTETALTNKKSKWKLLGKQKVLILMSVPFVLYIILFRYVPLWGWTMAFQRYKPSLSFFEQSSNNNIPITSCAIADNALNAFIANPPKLNVWELEDSQLSCITTDSGVLYDNSVGKITITAAQKTCTLHVSNSVFFQSNLVLLPKLNKRLYLINFRNSNMDNYS